MVAISHPSGRGALKMGKATVWERGRVRDHLAFCRKMLQMSVLWEVANALDSPVFTGNSVIFNELVLMRKKGCLGYTF
jgi:hypothetical protein